LLPVLLVVLAACLAAPTPLRAEEASGSEQVVRSTTESFTFVYRRRYLSVIQGTLDIAEEARTQMLAELGGDQRGPTIEVRFARNVEEMRSLCPRPPPEWADAVAFSPENVIVISLTTSHHRPVSYETVFRHELAHLVLRWLVADNQVPRWFNEGLAIMLSGELIMERIQLIWPVAARGDATPFRRLDRNFPEREFDANQAYAESADVVRFLARYHGRWRLQELLQRVHRGQPFYEAMSATWGMTEPDLEDAWRRDLRQRYSVIPSVTAGLTLWVMVGLLAVYAYIKRRRDIRRRIEAMADESPEGKDPDQAGASS
jgi:hypothetical protein